MTDLSKQRCVVLDHGYFIEAALRLARDVGKVYYCDPTWEQAFSTIDHAVIGDGYDEIERVGEIWDVIDKVDFCVFPDVHHSGMQLHLEKMDMPVWGARKADELELKKVLFRAMQRHLGMVVPEYEVVIGLEDLRKRLQADGHEDEWIKISPQYRGIVESFQNKKWELTREIVDELGTQLGIIQNNVHFLCEKNIDAKLEGGLDTYTVDGQHPKVAVQGYERKDQGYFAVVQPWDEIPKELTSVSDALWPELKARRCRQMISSEVKITEDKRSILLEPTCFSADTEVLTVSGWKRFYELSLTDSVCTLNPLTKEIEYHIPQKHISKLFDGEMVEITNRKRDLELLVTPDHAVWGTDRSGKFKSVRADEIPGEFRIPRSGQWKGIELESYTIPEHSNNWDSGYLGNAHKSIVRNAVRILGDDWLRFLGIYLAEGNCGKWQVNITQTKYRDEMWDILQKLPFHWKKTKCGFRCSNVQLRNLLHPMGIDIQKRIPSYVKELSQRQINVFLDAYCLGDGSIVHGNRLITCPSKIRADEIQELFLKAGSVAWIETYIHAGKSFNVRGQPAVCRQDSYRIRERRRFKDFFLNGWSSNRSRLYLRKKRYSGPVFDVEVENHILYVRRNGKPCWSGNCRFPSPAGEEQMELYGNFSEIIAEGAAGRLVQPTITARFACEAMVEHNGDDCKIRALEVPDSVRQWVKLYCTARVGKLLAIAPGSSVIGAVVGVGDSPGEALDHLKDNAAALKGQPVTVHVHALAELLQEIEEAQDKGIHFTDKPMPEPGEVVEEPE